MGQVSNDGHLRLVGMIAGMGSGESSRLSLAEATLIFLLLS